MVAYQVSERHAYRLIGLARSTRRAGIRHGKQNGMPRCMRLTELPAQRMWFRCRLLTAMLLSKDGECPKGMTLS
jgi:hypothetical protein